MSSPAPTLLVMPPCPCRESIALPAAILTAMRSMLRSVRADAGRTASDSWLVAVSCLIFLLASGWANAAALRAGGDLLLVESCAVRGFTRA